MTQLPEISDYLYANTDSKVYAIVDGASLPNVLASLATLNTPYCCLQRGELTLEEAITAAYLLLLPIENLSWFMDGWGKHRGILILTNCSLTMLRDHFRQFLIVYDERGQPMQFRFYDPRVLSTFLEICSAEQYQLLFGPIDQLLMESATGKKLLRFFAQLSKHQNDALSLTKTV